MDRCATLAYTTLLLAVARERRVAGVKIYFTGKEILHSTLLEKTFGNNHICHGIQGAGSFHAIISELN